MVFLEILTGSHSDIIYKIFKNILESIRMSFRKYATLFVISILIIIHACNPDDSPAIFDPTEVGASKPIIKSITPKDFALAAYDILTISGENFSPFTDSIKGNMVYFYTDPKQKLPGKIISATTNEIKVIPPNIGGKNVYMVVVVPDAYETVTYGPYELKYVNEKIKGTADEVVKVIAVDNNENVYEQTYPLSGNGSIYKITPEGEKTLFADLPFSQAGDMKFGNDGALYIQWNNNTNFYRIPAGGGQPELIMKFPKRMKYFDFGPNNTIYAGGAKSFSAGVYLTDMNMKLPVQVGDYTTVDIKALCVYNEYLYVADQGSGGKGIYRSKIKPDGTLDNKEVYFDWASVPAQYKNANINTIIIAKDGSIIVATTNNVDPIFKIKPDKTIEILYPGLLYSPATHLAWGKSEYFYQVRASDDPTKRGIYKIYFRN